MDKIFFVKTLLQIYNFIVFVLQLGNWNKVFYIHDMQKLEGRVNGVEMSKWAIGKGYWWNINIQIYIDINQFLLFVQDLIINFCYEFNLCFAGPIQKTHTAIHIGYGKGFRNFKGYMDDVSYSANNVFLLLKSKFPHSLR